MTRPPMKLKKALAAIILLLLTATAGRAQDQNPKDLVIKDDEGKSYTLYKNSYALIIGASEYNNGWPKLPGVMKDVETIKEILGRHNFACTVIMNPDNGQLRKSIDDFINSFGFDPDNRLMIYFAGHGHTIKSTYNEEMGYIVPVNSPNPFLDKNGFMSSAMNMQEIEVFAKKIQSKHALFLFDACFSGSIFSLSRAIPENITYKTTKPVRQFITSGSAEETVPDKSIFLDQLAAALYGEADLNRDGFITGSELGEFLQEKVVNYSRGSQHPQYGKIRNPNLDKGDFVFVKLAENIAAGNNERPSGNNNNSATMPTPAISGQKGAGINKPSVLPISNTGFLYLYLSAAYAANSYPTRTKEKIDYDMGFPDVTVLPLDFEIGAYMMFGDNITAGAVLNYMSETVKGTNTDDAEKRKINLKLSIFQFGGSMQYYPFSKVGRGLFLRADLAGALGSISETGMETYTSSSGLGFGAQIGAGYQIVLFKGFSLVPNFNILFRAMPGSAEYATFENGSYVTFTTALGIMWMID